MTANWKLFLALPILAALSGCMATGANTVNTQSELEATLDQDIDGDGTVPQAGVEVAASGS